LELWLPKVSEDFEKDYNIGLFYDLLDSNQDLVRNGFLDLVNNIKPKDYEKGLTGAAMFNSPEEWYQTRWNLVTSFSGQTTQIENLFEAYYVNQ
jgi:hypothetical protein